MQVSPATPLPTSVVWDVALPKELEIFLPVIHSCILKIPNTGITISEVTLGIQLALDADLNLFWGEIDPGNRVAFKLGESSLSIIVNNENPLHDIPLETVIGIFTSQVEDWQLVSGAGPLSSEKIQAWIYPPGEITRKLMEDLVPELPLSSPYLWLAPQPGAMIEAIANDPAAIGFIPVFWLTSAVHAVEVTGLEDRQFPILAIMDRQPGENETLFLACLQQEISKNP